MFNELNTFLQSAQNVFEEDDQTYKRELIKDELDDHHDIFQNNSLINFAPLFNTPLYDLNISEDSSPDICESSHLTSTFFFSRANVRIFDPLEQNCILYKPHIIMLKVIVKINREELACSLCKAELKLVNITDKSIEKITFKSIKTEVNEDKIEILFNNINLKQIKLNYFRWRRPNHVFQINIGLINSKNQEFNETIQSAAFKIFARKPHETVKETPLSNLELQELLDLNFSL